ncbi:hypothetical protein CLOSTASPAR_00458 [[Clostridium] asparagiforme DSM 15981]|uniref:Uncharacterized protein n=1 Tax=[Clostridium] asparagiforme DSM 15981 TaxID=518636 RepID=C0CU09_9FIRM|nr:hypothetical protein CLOSTASPAR_00458 [[Clostridium] asparagiforme DSM 15981]
MHRAVLPAGRRTPEARAAIRQCIPKAAPPAPSTLRQKKGELECPKHF